MKTISLKFEDIPDETKSHAEVFIIEMLPLDNIKKGQLDGEILCRQLELMGRQPRYIRVNDQNEFRAALLIFRQSNYRYLHISCHGMNDTVVLGSEFSDYYDFAQMTAGMLKSRRISFSACCLGNQPLAEELFKNNPGMHSFLAPKDTIPFETASAFWVSFFTLMYQDCQRRNQTHVGHRLVGETAKKLGHVFSVRMFLGQVKTTAQTIEFLSLEDGEEQLENTIPLKPKPRKQ